MKPPHPAPHRAGCRPALPTRTLPARPCSTLTLQAVEARLARVEDLLSNVARLHRKEVCLRYGWSERSFYRHQSAGRLPTPIRLGGPLWRLLDLEAMEKAGQLPRPKSA